MTFIDPGEILIPLHEIAKTIGMSSRQAIRSFGRCNWAFQLGDSGQWYCYESVFAAQMPRYYAQWRELKDSGSFLMPNRARVTRNPKAPSDRQPIQVRDSEWPGAR